MEASRFSDAQKAFILMQGGNSVPVAEVYREAGISEATYFNWRKSTLACPLKAVPPEVWLLIHGSRPDFWSSRHATFRAGFS